MNSSRNSVETNITSNAEVAPPSENAPTITAKECEKICNEMLKCMGKHDKKSDENKKKPYEPLTGVIEYFIFWN